jgi:hypothetical protein
MLKNTTAFDLTISVAGENVVAHRFVVEARCPSLLSNGVKVHNFLYSFSLLYRKRL